MTTADSTDVARREAGGAPDRSPQTVLDVFTSESFKQQVALALPKSIDVNQMMRIVQTEVRMNADLQKCTPASFMGALLKAAQSGLRPGMFGEGWIIARWSGKLHSMEAQFQPGYQGLAQLAYRSGEVSEIHAFPVYEADHFKYQLGSDPKIEHVPDMTAEHRDEDIVAFYAVVKLTNGGTLMKVMRRADVDSIRDRFGPKTKAGKIVGPWVSDYEPMGCKTVLIQCLKLAPKDSERLQAALQAENDAVFGDRVASSIVDVPASVGDRVAQRIGADGPQVDGDTGEVIDGEAEEAQLLGDEGWSGLLKSAEEFGFNEDDVLGNAAAYGYDGPGPEMPRDVGVYLFRAMKQAAEDAVAAAEGEDVDGELVDEKPLDSQTLHDAQREQAAASNVAHLPTNATKKQLAEIAKAYKASGMYEAEFASLLDEYGGDVTVLGYGLDEERAGFVLEAMAARAEK